MIDLDTLLNISQETLKTFLKDIFDAHESGKLQWYLPDCFSLSTLFDFKSVTKLGRTFHCVFPWSHHIFWDLFSWVDKTKWFYYFQSFSVFVFPYVSLSFLYILPTTYSVIVQMFKQKIDIFIYSLKKFRLTSQK